MLAGLATTAAVCLGATILALAAGLGLSLLLLSPFVILRMTTRLYVEIARGTPVLVILFLLYYGGPSFGLVLDPVPAGILGLGLYTAGFFAEIFRAGFNAIPAGQREAARMVGLSRSRILRRIEIPQMAGIVVPPSVNQLVILVKESALLSIITVAELTKNAVQMSNETFLVVEPYLGVALLYWLLIEMVARIGSLAEARFAGRWA